METKNPTLADQHVGRRLRGRREELNLSQQELADQLGITFQQLQKYERGANRVSAGRLFDLAKALETRITYFFEGLDGVAFVRRGVSEEAAAPIAPPMDKDAAELLAAFGRIKDAETRKSILALTKKAAGAGKPAPGGKRKAKSKAR